MSYVNGTNGSYAHHRPSYYQQQQAQQQQLQYAAANNQLFNARNGTNGYANPYSHQQQQLANNNSTRSSSSASTPSSQSQNQYNVTTQHYSQLVQHPNFNNNRSPFFQVEKRCCVMPVFSQKRIQFRISLGNEDVVSITHTNNAKALHLRLFNFQTHEHQSWNASQCDVSINNRKIVIDKRSTRSGVKKKGYHIVSPLDITKEAKTTMDFEITSNGPFGGVAVIEIVKVFSVDAIGKRIEQRCKPIDARKDKKCAICNKTSDLLRCSRCKSVWYCGTQHQAKDWPLHQTICSPTEFRPKLKSISFKQAADDEVVCGETKVSLRCPLSICRIRTPIRGTDCTHPQCVDLTTFLAFSHRTGNWQCPVCLKPLKFNLIAIDNEMKNILDTTDDDIDLVRLYPDGKFIPITLQEQREADNKTQVTKRKRKRKQIETVQGPNAKRAKHSAVAVSNGGEDANGSNSAPEDDNGQNLINPIVLD